MRRQVVVSLSKVNSMSSKIILGIDPGYGRTGYGIVKQENGKLQCLDYGVIETHKGDEFSQRIKEIHNKLRNIIKQHKPQYVVVEELFFCTNVTTAIKVGQARGVILLTIVQEGLPVIEFTPLQVKQSITGYGKADKAQVQKMVKLLLNIDKIPKPDDAADALALAICGFNSIKLLKATKKI